MSVLSAEENPWAQPKFTLYKRVKVGGKWRYFRAALSTNNKVKPHVILVGGKQEKREDGSYCVRHSSQWIGMGNDPAEALRQRTKLMQADSLKELRVSIPHPPECLRR